MLTHDGLIRWRDWLVANLPDEALPPAAKSALRNATVDEGTMQLVYEYLDGSPAVAMRILGPLNYLHNQQITNFHRFEDNITTYLNRWYGDWIAVFEEVANDADA